MNAAQPLQVVFHVFSNNGRDQWTTSLAKAILYYKRFKRVTGCAMLYLEVYTDRENDEMLLELCLLTAGNFPS